MGRRIYAGEVNITPSEERKARELLERQVNAAQIKLTKSEYQQALLADKIKELEAENKQVVAKNNQLLSEQKNIMNEIEVLVGTRDDLRKELSELDLKIKSGNRRIEEGFKAKELELNTVISGLNKEVERLKKSCEQEKENESVIRDGVNKMFSGQAELAISIDLKEKQLAELTRKHLANQGILVEIENNNLVLTAIKEKIKKHEAIVKETEAQITLGQKQLQAVKEAITGMESKREELQKEKDDFMKVVATVNRQRIKNEEEARRQEKLYQKLGIPIKTT